MSTDVFGERLRQIRRNRGVSQRDLARQCGVDFTYISKIERGRMPPPGEETLGKIVDCLNAEELFYLADKIPHSLRSMVKGNPKLAALLMYLSGQRLPDEVYEAMIALACEEAR